MVQENDLCSSTLNGYEQGKTAFVKAADKNVAVIEV